MTPAAHKPPAHWRPRDAAALVRLALSWLLVAVLAVDLVTAPLHTHRHHGEWSAGTSLVVSAEHPGHLSGPAHVGGQAHVDHGTAPGISHSITALRSAVELTAGAPPSDQPTAAAPWFVPALGPPAGPTAFVWPPDRQRAEPAAFKSLPPHGRAPPLHA